MKELKIGKGYKYRTLPGGERRVSVADVARRTGLTMGGAYDRMARAPAEELLKPRVPGSGVHRFCAREVREMQALRAEGMTYTDIAEVFDCAPTTVRNALTRGKWREAGDE